MRYERITPKLQEDTSIIDKKAYSRRARMFIDPIINELYIFIGVICQLFFAVRDLFFLPLTMFQKPKTEAEKAKIKYNQISFIAFLIPLIAIQIIGWFYIPTFQLMIDILAGQSIYPMKGVYTLSYIIMKHLSKMKNFAHRAVRGAIRDNSSVAISLVLLTFYNFFSFIVQMIQICTLISGYEQFQLMDPIKQAHKNLFLIALVNIQVINYKKFISKFLDGNQFILESYYRINAIFAIIYHWLFNSIEQVYYIVGTELCFSLARYYLCSYTLDYDDYHIKMVKNKNNALLELDGKYTGHVHKSNFMLSYHESIAYILTLLIQFGPIPFRISMLVFLAVMTVLSLIVPHALAKSIPIKDKKKTD